MAGLGAPKTGGREKGTPNKATTALKEMILGALSDAGGQQYLARIAAEQPAAFLTLLGKVLPTTLAGERSAPLQTISCVRIVGVRPQPRDDLP